MTPWGVCDYEGRRVIAFGITESIFAFGLADALGGGALGAIGADAIGGAAGGALLGGVEGGGRGALLGAAGGAITGGAAGAAGAFGPVLADATGLPAVGIEGAIGAAGGAAGGLASGGNPLLGAAVGGAGGIGAGLGAPATPAAAPTGSPLPTGGGASAGAIAGPSGLLDQTGGTNFLGSIDGGAGGGFPQFSPGTGGPGAATPANISGAADIGGAPSASGGGPAGAPASIAPGSPGGPDLSLATGTGFGGEGSFSSADPASGGGISSFISNHWPMLASAGILGFEGLTKNQSYPAETQLQNNATTASGQAQSLMNPIQTGILPPGAQQAVDASTAANKAGVASTYGNLGLAGSTMEQQANQGVTRNAAAQTYQIASDLLSKGIDLSRLSAADLTNLLESQMKEDAQFQGALTSFAGGLAGAKLAA